MKDYYQILGINEYATIDDIRTAYKALVKLWHPDICSRPDAYEKFVDIAKAYEILSDEQKRKQYDEGRKASDSTTIEQEKEPAFADLTLWAQILVIFKRVFLVIFTLACVIFVLVIAFKVYN
ncbi:MAG TPA: DnaJ domain-containing protein, partial [Candidatus Deferrimicrobium sp.]|nr:DnaJ domain-containing protein [Candidatus Deferrimicrobium sp.]